VSTISSVGTAGSGLTTTGSTGTSGTSTTGTSAAPGTISVNGLISGLDTSSIITGLEAVQQQQINDITSQETAIQAKQAEYKALQVKLTTLQGTLSTLEKPTNGAFSGRTATASDPSLATVAASSSAVAGVYNLTINSLAKANIVASQGFDSANTAIGQGTFGIENGSGAVTTVTINSANATLQGLANAINTSGAGVTASVVNDGSGSHAFRLLLTANNTGTANDINITNNLTNTGGGAVTPEFGQNYVGSVDLGAGFTGTATPTVNTGAGGFTGTTNNQYTFTVVGSGTVGTDSIQLQYSDATGANTGTITVDPSQVGQPVSVAQGLQVTLGAGSLVAGQTFSVKAYVPTVQTAQDASVTLGSGDGALTVKNSTNSLNNLINGVTIQLNSADSTKNLAITVANDTTTPATAINAFVSAYNDLQSEISTDTAYDPSSSSGGILLGDSRATSIQNQLAGIIGNVVPGVNQASNRLAALGITLDQNGQLQVNSTTLQSALSGGISGVSLGDINNLFGNSGQSTNAAFQFVSAGTSAKASVPVTVNITQAAQQGAVTSSNDVASQVTIDGTNDTFAITLDGKSSTLTLAQGTYTQSQLATSLQTAINSDTDLVGRSIAVGVSNNRLTFTSGTYGSQSQVTIGSANSNSVLGLNGNESGNGTDVQGTFTVNGITEAASGNGQFLLGNSGNANTAGLQVRVTLTPDQVTGGNTSATVTVSRGLASQLDSTLTSLLDPVNGQLANIDAGFTSQISALDQRKADETTLMNDQTARLQAEFTQMEETLSQLQSSTNFLTQTAQSLSGVNPNAPAASSSSSKSTSS
jgi:flagellar hook-associated protein 2